MDEEYKKLVEKYLDLIDNMAAFQKTALAQIGGLVLKVKELEARVMILEAPPIESPTP